MIKLKKVKKLLISEVRYGDSRRQFFDKKIQFFETTKSGLGKTRANKEENCKCDTGKSWLRVIEI